MDCSRLGNRLSLPRVVRWNVRNANPQVLFSCAACRRLKQTSFLYWRSLLPKGAHIPEGSSSELLKADSDGFVFGESPYFDDLRNAHVRDNVQFSINNAILVGMV